MHFNTGTVEGTGAAIEITCGFIPDFVALFNIDGDCMAFWTSDMPAANAFKTIAAGTTAQVTSNGITKDTVDDFLGFTIGADTDLNVTSTAETICWVAFAK